MMIFSGALQRRPSWPTGGSGGGPSGGIFGGLDLQDHLVAMVDRPSWIIKVLMSFQIPYSKEVLGYHTHVFRDR